MKKKSVAVLTATRAEYGLLKPVIIKLKARKEIETKVLVTGTHLAPSFGNTYKELEADKIQIDKKIPILFDDESNVSVTNSMAMALIGFGSYFQENRPDGLVVLGDRYETLAVTAAAMMHRIPVFHIAGGEATEGVLDDAIRHCITKMSYLHFASTDSYRKRVIQLGESPERVFTVGALGVENAKRERLLSYPELCADLGLKEEKEFAVVTYHPETLTEKDVISELDILCKVLEKIPDMQFIITKANADFNGKIINGYLEKNYGQNKSSNMKLYGSLGVKRYLSALRYCCFVIGNSSSGIAEAPSFHVATINIGDRQKGRLQAESVININMKEDELEVAIKMARENKHNGKYRDVVNPYEGSDTSTKIVDHICDFLTSGRIDLKKKFHDINFELSGD